MKKNRIALPVLILALSVACNMNTRMGLDPEPDPEDSSTIGSDTDDGNEGTLAPGNALPMGNMSAWRTLITGNSDQTKRVLTIFENLFAAALQKSPDDKVLKPHSRDYAEELEGFAEALKKRGDDIRENCQENYKKQLEAGKPPLEALAYALLVNLGLGSEEALTYAGYFIEELEKGWSIEWATKEAVWRTKTLDEKAFELAGGTEQLFTQRQQVAQKLKRFIQPIAQSPPRSYRWCFAFARQIREEMSDGYAIRYANHIEKGHTEEEALIYAGKRKRVLGLELPRRASGTEAPVIIEEELSDWAMAYSKMIEQGQSDVYAKDFADAFEAQIKKDKPQVWAQYYAHMIAAGENEDYATRYADYREKGVSHEEASIYAAYAHPLHWAAYNRYTEAARLLIEQGADVKAKDDKGMTPLHLAAEKGYTDFARLLIEKGANVNAEDGNEMTPLHKAVEKGNTELVELLIENDVDVKAKDDKGMTPLHWAAYRGHTDLAELLIENRADVNAKNNSRRTPLHWALIYGHPDLAALLIEQGADAKAKTVDGSTPLHSAAYWGHTEAARLLIEQGADVEAKDKYGTTPLYQAAKNGYTDLAQLLIDKGADVNAKDSDGVTPLHWAVQEGKTDFARLLIEKGADVNAKNEYDRNTPLHLAIINDRTEVAKLLIEKDADVNAKNLYGRTPLSLALQERHIATEEVAELLRKRGAVY